MADAAYMEAWPAEVVDRRGARVPDASDALLRQGLLRVAELAVQVFDARVAQIVWPECGVPVAAGPEGARQSSWHPLSGRVLQFGEMVVEHNEAAAVALGASRWSLAVGAPLRTDDGVVRGALCLAFRHETAWGDRQQELLDTLAADAAAHLDQHLAAEEVRAFYENTLNAMPAQLALYDLEARFTYVGRNTVHDADVRTWLVGRTDLDYARRRGHDEAMALRRMAIIRRVARVGRTVQFEETMRAGQHRRHFIRVITPVVDEAGTVVQVLAYGVDITDRRLAELELERFRTMLDHADEAIFLIHARTGRFVDVNQGAERLLGCTREELLRLSVGDMDARTALGEPATWARLVRRICGSEAPVFFERTYRRPDGTTFPAEVSLTSETFEGSDYLLGLVRDVTERRRAEEALRRSEHRYRSLIEQASDAIFISTGENGYVEVNTRACELTGYTRGQLLEMRPEELVVLDDVEAARRNWQAMQTGETYRYERTLRRGDGSLMPVEVNTTLNDDGLVLAIVRDVTQRKQFEEGLIAAKERAEEMSRLKSTFLANMSHEFRTPLAGIIGFADILVIEGDEQTRDFAEAIHANGQRLLDTLNAVLELARLESDTLQLEPVPVDLRAVVRDAIDAYRATAEERGLAIDVCLPEVAFEVRADAEALGRVLDALLANAVKFTDEGGITVSGRSEDGAAILTVADTGIGIDPDFVAHVFDEFRQQSSGDTRAFEGSGLGLTLARRLIELMNGTIEVDSELGEGSTFTVRLPRPQ